MNSKSKLPLIGSYQQMILMIIIGITALSWKTAEEKNRLSGSTNTTKAIFEVDTLETFDSIRMRKIPFALFKPVKTSKKQKPVKLVIFSHGYGSNYPLNYLNYTYLTAKLASKGFWVLSIQHELSSDPLIPTSGNIQTVRMPFWKRGEENILFVYERFKTMYPELEIASIHLIGHSNGGDMSVLTASDHPELIKKVITLDHMRMPIPLVKSPQFSSLRSSDKIADTGVIPDKSSCDSLGIRIIQLRNITHNEMNNEASEQQKKKINRSILKLLKHRN